MTRETTGHDRVRLHDRTPRHHGRRLLVAASALLLVAGPALVGVSGSATAAGTTPTVKVSGFDGSRVDGGWGLFSSCLATTNGYLQDPANYGPSGTDKVDLDLSAGGVSTASASTLAGTGIFFTGYIDASTVSDAEKSALLDYVKGGGAMVVTSDETGYDLSDLFGMTLADSPGGIENGTITDPTSPVADGPFGTVSTFTEYDAVAHWTDVGPGQTVGTNPEGPAIVVIPPGALAAGSGPVVLASDVDVFSDCPNEGDTPDGSITNKTLIENIFAYLADYEAEPPTTTTTAAPSSTTSTTSATSTTATAAQAVSTEPAFTG